jgi:hypothetical protein
LNLVGDLTEHRTGIAGVDVEGEHARTLAH